MRGFVRRFVARGALVGMVLLLAVLLSGYERDRGDDEWWTRIDWSSVEMAPLDFPYPSERRPHSPQSDPATWSSTARAAWDIGFRTCRRSWAELVVAAGLSDWIQGSRPTRRAQLEWVAGKLQYLDVSGSSSVGPLDEPFVVEGCVDGYWSFLKSGSARSGRDRLP